MKSGDVVLKDSEVIMKTAALDDLMKVQTPADTKIQQLMFIKDLPSVFIWAGCYISLKVDLAAAWSPRYEAYREFM